MLIEYTVPLFRTEGTLLSEFQNLKTIYKGYQRRGG